MDQPLPPNEAERLRALRRYALLEAPSEPAFARAACLAAQLCGAPVALLSLVDEDRERIAGDHGLPAHLPRQLPRTGSFAAAVVAAGEPLVVPDAGADPRFAGNPLVARKDGLRRYAGVPLTTRDGQSLGALAIADATPYAAPGTDQLASLVDLAAFVVDALERRTAQSFLDYLVSSSAAVLLQGRPVDRRLDYISPNVAQELGYTAEELVADGRFWAAQIHPEDRDRVLAEFQRAQEQRANWVEYDYRFRHKDGSYRWLASLTRFSYDAAGRAIGGLSYVRDITQRKDAAAALRRQALIVDTISEAVIVTDLEGRIRDCNPAAETMFGYTCQDLHGQTPARLMHASAPADRLPGTLDDALTAGRWSGEIPFVRKDGSTGYCEAVVVPVRDERGAPVALVGVNRDITARKRAEEDLRRAHDELEARVRERTAALERANEALQAEIAERRRAEDQLARQARQAAMRADVAAALADGGELRAMLQRCAEALVTPLDAALSRIWTLDEAEQVLELQASAGDLAPRADAYPAYGRIAVGDRCPGRIAATRLPHLVNDLPHDAQYRDLPWVIRDGIVAFAGHPLVVEERVVGVLAVLARQNLAGDTLDALASVASVIAQGIERKRTVEALRESEERYRLLVEHSPDAVVVYRDGRIVYANPAAVRLVGAASADELVGADLLSIVPPGTRAEAEARRRQLELRGQPTPLAEFKLLRRDGLLVDVETTGLPIAYAGRPSALALLRDVTARRRAEEAQRAREVAERASRAKNDLVSRMSHELRTPLNAVLGFAQLLEQDGLTAAQRGAVDQILEAGRDLLALVDEALDLSRVEAGRLTLAIEPVDPRGLVRRALAQVEPLARERAIALRDQLDEATGGWAVLADRQVLKQVLRNLLSNAIKYNRDGGTVTVDCRPVDADSARLTVRDTGVGIRADRLDRLFTPFERLDAARTQVKGAGLGLALVKRQVEAMGGRIGVDSVAGQGSAFWVELPLSRQASSAESPEAPAPLPGHPATGRDSALATRGATILYIEDNASNLTLVKRIFDRWPRTRLLVAMQGQPGLAMAREHHPNLLLLDLDLPDLPGEEVLRRWRADPATRAIPVVVVSADATPAQIARLRAAGARDYLTKPLDIARFLATVDEALAGRR